MPAVPRLVALFGPKRGVTREFDGVLRIGRAADADLQLIDERVSRDHCTLEVAPDGVRLRDLGSRNGTWLKGKRIEQPVVLQPGDQFAVGESLLAFEPDLEALRSKDAEITVVLTRQGTQAARRAGAAGSRGAALSDAKDEGQAAQALAELAHETFGARTVAVLRQAPGEVLRVLSGLPTGSQLTVPAELLALVRAEKRAASLPVTQTDAEVDDVTTRVKSANGFVACAPIVRLGSVIGALCVCRAKDLSAEELNELQALATSGAAAFRDVGDAPAAAKPLGVSAKMRQILALAEKVGPMPSTVLLNGESGSGKEEIARYIHACSPRRAGPFVALNCGAIPPELSESELFGHEKGAFTGATNAHEGVFERADGGTLLLDELGDLPLPMQVKLLRVLQERLVTRVGARTSFPVDVRVIAATHRDLPAQVKAGVFREDLYWRLNVVSLWLSPLRERPDDVTPLAELFLKRLSGSLGVPTEGFTDEARAALTRCPWPGNVRQLANAIERAVVLKTGAGPIGVLDLPPEVSAPPPSPESPGASGPSRPLAESIAALEREQITLALHRARGVKTTAAQALGISRPTLDRKLEELGIDLFAEKK
jgi:transcriptional regulator with PAS, ATPase and Fis domain